MALTVETEGSTRSAGGGTSHLVTKHSGAFRGNYSRLLEITRGGLLTRDPESGKVTNEWLFSDVLAVAAAGSRVNLQLVAAKNALCSLCANTKLICSFDSAQAAEAVAHNIQQAMLHGYDESRMRRQETSDALVPASAPPPPAAAAAEPARTARGVEEALEEAPSKALDAAAAAAAELQKVLDGSSCLAGGEHVWRKYDGQRGSGRCCERCFMCQDALLHVMWRVSPALSDAAAAAGEPRAVLASWKGELSRVTSGNGCIAGGEHAWLDSNMTMLRLTVWDTHPDPTSLTLTPTLTLPPYS